MGNSNQNVPTYNYAANIKSPHSLGMSSKGSLSALSHDINGLQAYSELLVSGGGKASKSHGPMGNKFFLKTGGKCMDVKTKKKVDRYVFINNIPQGNIPFISAGTGTNFKDYKGLIPGLMENMNELNPFKIMQSFTIGPKPDCQEVSLDVIDVNNHRTNESHYITTVDLKNMDSCLFKHKKNPITKRKCSEGFKNNDTEYNNLETTYMTLNNDNVYFTENIQDKIYFSSLLIFGVFIFYKIIEKNNLIK